MWNGPNSLEEILKSSPEASQAGPPSSALLSTFLSSKRLHGSPLGSDHSVAVLAHTSEHLHRPPHDGHSVHIPHSWCSFCLHFLSLRVVYNMTEPPGKQRVYVSLHTLSFEGQSGWELRNSRKELKARTKVEARQEQCSRASSTCFHILSRNTTCPGVAPPH